MTLLSKLRPLVKFLPTAQKSAVHRPMSDHRIFPMQPSRWQWNKFKDLVHFYLFLGIIPCSLFVGGMNLFVGPATLSEIPEDYTPKHWEYYKNPVTRLLARYVLTNPQQEYEKYCTYLFIEQEKIKLRELESKIMEKMDERVDYQAYYFRPVSTAKYYRIIREGSADIEDLEDPIPKEQ
ncbi:unnamed protein product [Ceutorhynchus assimilis]|uniref:NADH dehydrogenase [ubiquinone] 1 beta subcomplex subunit 5, mitochondrial n=1 Tax=Ceutorhynchus assimilis TaxID=467358 RepID=A0A9N9MWK3_9CUCU|nr:unnamed protein product [Ceutorhynchus assimilis]